MNVFNWRAKCVKLAEGAEKDSWLSRVTPKVQVACDRQIGELSKVSARSWHRLRLS